MGQFRWETERGVALLDTLAGEILREHRDEAKLSEECRVKRIISVNQKTLVEPDAIFRRRLSIWVRFGNISVEHQALPQSHKIEILDIKFELLA